MVFKASLPLFLSLSLTCSLLVACGPTPSTTSPAPSPSASSPGMALPSATAAPSAEPSAAPTATAMPSASGTPLPSAAPTSSPSVSPSASPSPQPTPVPSASASGPSIYDYRETFFTNYGVNPFVEAATDPLSTFAADVDTASYALTRNYLNSNQLPPPAAVRTEEFLNSFNYQYPQPVSGKFAIQTDLAPAYFGDSETKLLRVGIQGQEVLDRNRKPAVLTVVIDVSGSMNRENRLELVKQSLRLLFDSLRPTDKVAIVLYGNTARVALPHTPLIQRGQLDAVLNSLRPEGSTNAEAGLLLAYQEATQALTEGALNRVILCSDGVANVGDTGPDAILNTIRSESAQGITLTTLGFGMDGFNDTLMEQLANQGDGQYAYIDTLEEARRLFVERLTGTLQVIAKDVKIQVAFDPKLVAQYRLLGYENRDVADEDFRNDAVDAGEVGSNHSVTALYELRFNEGVQEGAYGSVTVRYADVDAANQVKEVSRSLALSDLRAFSNASGSFRLATAVAEMAEILRQSVFADGGRLTDVLALARTAQEQGFGDDAQVTELMGLLERAASLQLPVPAQSIASLVDKSRNPEALPQWDSYLIRQLGGRAAGTVSSTPSAQP
ncbi:MAG: vWA domain-containing protein [Candidatus Sericytochromatia bacterium]